MVSKNVLAVEFDFPKLRIAEIRVGNPLKVLQFKEVDYTVFSEEGLSRFLKQQFKSRNAVVVSSLSSAVHQIESYPLEISEIVRIMPSEARRISMLRDEELVYDYEILEKDWGSAGEIRLGALLVIASRNELQARLSFFETSGLKVKKLTTIITSLLNGIRMQADRWGDDRVLAAHIGHQNINILIAHRGKLLFSVEAALDLKDFAGNEAAFLPRLVSEIKRSFMYFNQQFRSGLPHRIILSGIGNLREVTGPLMQSFGVDVELFEPEGWADYSPLRSKEQLPCLAAMLGAVSRSESSLSIDLSKGVTSAKRSQAQRALARKALLAGLCFLMAIGLGGSLYFHTEASRLQEDLARVNTQVASLQAGIDEANSRAEAQNEAQKQSRLLESMVTAGPLLSAALKSLSLAVPAEMKFTALQARPSGSDWELLIQGEVLAENSAIVNMEFALFMEALENNPLIRSRSFRKPIETSTVESARNLDGAGLHVSSVSAPGARLSFDLGLVVGR